MEQLRRDGYVVAPLTIDRVRQGLATVEALGSLSTICSWRFTLGFVLVWAGRLDEAEERLTSSLALASTIGDTARRVRSLLDLALAHRLRRDVRATAETARAGLSAARDARMRMYMAQGHAHLGWVAYTEGRPAEAREHLDQACGMWEAAGPAAAMASMVL